MEQQASNGFNLIESAQGFLNTYSSNRDSYINVEQ